MGFKKIYISNNEFDIEKKYIKSNIEYTKKAYGIEIKEIDIVTNGKSSSKKDSKKQAAFDMLIHVLEE